MKGKYLIVDKAILPDYFEKVIEARTLLRLSLIHISEPTRPP